MKVSVIIPVKNRADLLPVTLNNLLQQSLKPYEVIVVDDHSEDDLSKVNETFKGDVIFIKSKGKGPGAARNAGLNIATGNLIQFFDSDDLMTQNKLEVQALPLAGGKADLVYGPFVKATLDEGVWHQKDVIMQYYPVAGKSLANYVLQGWCNITQSAMFRKDLIDEVGPWREDLITHEDFEYWFRVGKVAKNIFHENKSCVIYRQHQMQITDLQVANESRWMNEIVARDSIKAGIDFSPALHSYFLFLAKEYVNKQGFVKRFGRRNSIRPQKKYLPFVPYLKLMDKWGRLSTNSNWQKMHGVLTDGAETFKGYVSLLPPLR